MGGCDRDISPQDSGRLLLAPVAAEVDLDLQPLRGGSVSIDLDLSASIFRSIEDGP